MSTSTIVTLKDGSQVSQTEYLSVNMNIEALAQENKLALFHLVEKCKNTGYKIPATPFGDSIATLKMYNLMNDDEKIHDDIRKIVLNSQFSCQLVNPLQDKQVSQM